MNSILSGSDENEKCEILEESEEFKVKKLVKNAHQFKLWFGNKLALFLFLSFGWCLPFIWTHCNNLLKEMTHSSCWKFWILVRIFWKIWNFFLQMNSFLSDHLGTVFYNTVGTLFYHTFFLITFWFHFEVFHFSTVNTPLFIEKLFPIENFTKFSNSFRYNNYRWFQLVSLKLSTTMDEKTKSIRS